MKVFLAALLIFLMAFAGLGLGLFFRRTPMRRGCAATGDDCRCEAQKQITECDCK